jgi:hypothetical protein
MLSHLASAIQFIFLWERWQGFGLKFIQKKLMDAACSAGWLV